MERDIRKTKKGVRDAHMIFSTPRRKETARRGGTREAQEGHPPWTIGEVERAGF